MGKATKLHVCTIPTNKLHGAHCCRVCTDIHNGRDLFSIHASQWHAAWSRSLHEHSLCGRVPHYRWLISLDSGLSTAQGSSLEWKNNVINRPSWEMSTTWKRQIWILRKYFTTDISTFCCKPRLITHVDIFDWHKANIFVLFLFIQSLKPLAPTHPGSIPWESKHYLVLNCDEKNNSYRI